MVLGLVALVWLAVAVRIWIDVRHELGELLDGHLAQAAALLVAQQAREIDDDHAVEAPALHRYAPKVAFQVFHEGRLALRSAGAPAEPMVASNDVDADGFGTVRMQGEAWRVFTTHGAKTDVQVVVGEQVSSRNEILRAVLRSTLGPMLIGLPLLGLACWWAISRGVTPLRRLGNALAQRSAQALEPIALANAPTEMLPVIDALNGLFGRIGALLESERRFTADAAHELRSPIAAIRAQAQVAMAEADPQLRRHALQGTLEGCDRAARLVDQLLTLSRLEALGPATMQPVDLAEIAKQAVAQLAATAIAHGQTIGFEAAHPCIVMGDATLLEVLVRNLVDNAVRYSGAAAQIAVSVQQEDDHAVLVVQDNGPGLADADLQRLGERFFRVAGNEQSGSGLGWSIVQRIAAAHRAQVQARRLTPSAGLLVRVALPLQP
jgi:two-component system sensor histidine kinase QseC